MAGQPTTRLHVSGYRFLVRRMEHALLRGDTSMVHDPMRAQSLAFIAGCVLAVVTVAVCAVTAFLRPDAALGDATVVMARESGALYVRVGDTWHPVSNLASARLIAGTAANPRVVNAARIDGAKRGPLLGIPGAPAVIANPLSHEESAWTICDDATTAVFAGRSPDIDRQVRQPSVLVTARAEGAATTYLLYDGRRAEVDLRNPSVVWALQLDGIEPRPVARALLDAIPEAPPIAVPYIPDMGSSGAIPGMRVGSVLRVSRVDSDDFYAVLAGGVQRVGEVAANLIRSHDAHGRRDVPSVSPDTIGGIPSVDSLPVATYPRRAGSTLGAREGGVLCAQWLPDASNAPLWMGDSLSTVGESTVLAQADGDGSHIDSVAMPSGRSAYVRASSLAGSPSDTGPLYLVTDVGVLYGIRDEATAKTLGIGSRPVAAPWPLLSLLPRGPELNRDSALVARDSFTPSP